MNTLRKKYIFAGCALIGGFLVFLFVLSMVLKESLVEYWNHQKMETLAFHVEGTLEKNNWTFSQADMDSLALENNITITVVDESFCILGTTSSREASQQLLSEKTMKVIREHEEELVQTGNSFFSNFDDNNKAFFVHVGKIADNGYIIIKRSITGFNSSMQVMEICYALAALLTVLLGIPVIIWLSGKMVKPISEINRVTKQISQLNFDQTVQVNSRDELGTLAESVNVMSDKLEETLGSLKKDVELRKALVRNMAHELKTPTAVIMGYAENMPYIAENQPKRLEKYCAVISDECERMDSMIHQMLEVSSYEYGEEVLNQTYFSVQDLLDSIRKFVLSDYPERTGIYEESCETEGEFYGDYEVLKRALYNYVKNAVRYGKKNGLIRIRAWEEDEWLQFTVFNQGAPIPEEEQGNIWNVFFKRNPARTRDEKSFGIGLSIVKQAALAHGGGVDVCNVKGGVEFLLSIRKIKK